MFAPRNTSHNENAIYEQQTAAAAKPLNQGVKGLAPKTPGHRTAPKTPFKGPQNDENAAFRGAKTGGKGKQEEGSRDGKGGKIEKTAFVTPAGPRTARAPLGNKTTNAKAAALQTPGPPATQDKPLARGTSPRLRRAKVKVHQAEADPLNDDAEERDIEYMPPRGVPLPDHPDECWPHDRTYPQLEGKNFTKGWWAQAQPSRNEGDDDDEGISDFEGKMQALEEKERQAKQQKAARQVSGAKVKPPSTLRSKDAASALSSMAKPSSVTPSFAAPTAAVKARQPTAVASKKPLALPSSARANMRHTAAKVASNTTLGYSKGRAVSANNRAPLTDARRPTPSANGQAQRAPPTGVPFGGGTTLDDLLGLRDLHVIDREGDDADELGGFGPNSGGDDDEDDSLANFQLEPVEL